MSPTQRDVVLDHMVLDRMVLVRVARDRIVLERVVLERVVLDGMTYIIAVAVLPRTFTDLFWPCTAGNSLGDSLGERGGGRTTFCCLRLRL